MDKRGEIPKKVVVILIILALILAGIAIYGNFASSSDKIKTNEDNNVAGAKIGVDIVQAGIEDKGLENEEIK